jgi:hypothetical protein
MSLPPFMGSSARWFFSGPFDFGSDCVDFMSDAPPLSRCIAPPDGAPPRSEGALCCVVEPADGASRPGPCAFAKPAPAIKAAAATEIKKRLVISTVSSRVCIAHADNERICLMFLKLGGSADFVL